VLSVLRAFVTASASAREGYRAERSRRALLLLGKRATSNGEELYGALHLAVTAVASLFLLAFNPLVVLHQGLLPQLFGIGLFRSGQRARRRSAPTGQAFEEGAQAPHAESVQRVT
jgi:hypothetical protein